jgi:hypothetical protein
MSNPYIQPLQFDESGYAVGAFYRYQFSKTTYKDITTFGVYAWWPETQMSGYIAQDKSFAKVIDIANRHNAAQIARYLTPAGCERLGIDL